VSTDKRLSEDEVVARLESGMTVGIGGWGSRRKPMSMIRAICRSDVRDLRVVAFGGPDVGLLCSAGKVREVVFAFVAADVAGATNKHSPTLEPHFRRARQDGAVSAVEYDEGQVLLGLQAAAWRVPFLPTRVGLGSDVFRTTPELATVTSPYPGPDGVGEELVAMPALELDAALCHLDVADARGNAAFLGPDLYFDDLMLAAARTGGRFISTDRVVPTAQLAEIAGTELRLRVNRMMVDGVVERDGAAHFTAAEPRHPRDEAVQQAYFAAAKSPEAWEEFRAEYVDVDEDTYQATVRAQGEGGAR
jgi:glutaconate CoA-transferase subunit A